MLKAETLVVFELYRKEPTHALRDRIVKLNIGLVKKEAHHWSNQCTENYDDLLQVGSMGLLRAIDRFDMDKGYAFSTFAVPYIRGEIQHYLRDKSPTLKMPRQWLALYNQGCKTIRTLRPKLNRDATDQEIAEVLGIKVTEWQEIKLACKNRSPLSLDAPVNEEEEGFTSLGELVQDHQYRSFQLAQEDSIRLHQALAHLEDRTREVVEFVFLKEFTHREVAEILGISAVTVSRQVKKGITLLKQIMITPLD
nr:RNA polymerase sigma factor SigF [Synechococcus sp. PCC 7502]